MESGFKSEMQAASEGISGGEKTESAGANAADHAEPSKFSALDTPFPEKPVARQNLEELLRIITKFQKSNQKRVVDVFE